MLTTIKIVILQECYLF